MAFTLIKGTFHVVNYSPDGDSIRFQPENRSLVVNLENGDRVRFNGRGHVQLRIEAIDTLETHFPPPSGGAVLHQPLKLARQATVALLDFVGVTQVVWDQTESTVLSANDGTSGYILARSVDRNGRPIAFAFAGDTIENDGAEIFLDVQRMQQSFNWLAVSSGLAYVTFYKGLFSDLRDALSKEAELAQLANRGIYAEDKTQTGFDAPDLTAITDEISILPKLFRRLSDYMVNHRNAVGFKEALEALREPVLDLRTSNFTHFGNLIEQPMGSTRIRLTCRPEELVFDETIPQPGPQFAALVAAMQ